MTALLALAGAALAALAGAAAVVVSGRRRYARANQVVPGVATRAPAAWAGAHTPEAKLHRRLRDAVAALRAGPAADGDGLLTARVALERQALAVDDRLVAVAALAAPRRAAPLTQVAAAVDAVEAAVATLATAGAGDGAAALDAAVAEVGQRLAFLAEARAELDPPPEPRRA